MNWADHTSRGGGRGSILRFNKESEKNTKRSREGHLRASVQKECESVCVGGGIDVVVDTGINVQCEETVKYKREGEVDIQQKKKNRVYNGSIIHINGGKWLR